MTFETSLIDSALRNWRSNVNRVGKLFGNLSQEQLLQEVAPGKNRLIYLWGHLTAFNDALIPLLGFGPRIHPELDLMFVSNPDRTVPTILLGEDLRVIWQEASQILWTGFSKLSVADWLQKHGAVSEEDFLREPHRNRFTVLLGRTAHIAYHLGQAKLLVSNLPNIAMADARKEDTIMQTSTMQQTSEQGADKNAIRPFHVNVAEAELTELRRRINATKWPERETVTDASQGVQLATIQALARYWATDYDWRKIEAKLNAVPQFMTEIDGLDIHFLHVRSKHENALPLIVTHGWPGSIIEQMKIIDPLTNPTAHGGNVSDAFHVVIPSMPGYGYSGKPTSSGWDAPRIARAWVVLMKRLGYTKFVAQGGDWGAVIVEQMGVQAAPELLGIHTNMPGIFSVDIDQAAFAGAPAPSGLSADEKVAYERLQFVYQKGIAYGYQMGLRPQTLYGIADSPVGLAAYFLDHDARSYELISRVFRGESEGLTRDDILDNITITWLTNTALSGARLYWENWGKLGYFNAKGVSIPVAVSVFPDELYPAPRSWTERAYSKLIHYNKVDKGGHFAAWEQPQLFSQEVRAGFRSLRSGAAKAV